MSRTIRRRNHYDLNWHVHDNFNPGRQYKSEYWTGEELVLNHCQRVYGHTDIEKAHKAAVAYFHSDGYRAYLMGSIPRSYRNIAEHKLRAASRRCTDKVRKLVDLDDIGDVERPSKRILSWADRWYW